MKKYTSPIAKFICLEEEESLMLNTSNGVKDTDDGYEDLSNRRQDIGHGLWENDEWLQ